LPELVLNRRLKFKHLFEKKARRIQGKHVTFSVLRLWGHRWLERQLARKAFKNQRFSEFGLRQAEGGELKAVWDER